jgi:hypothetical protein
VRARIATLAVLGVVGGGLVSPAAAQDEYGGLPEGEGREIVYGVCSGCHSIRLVEQQGMSRERWDHLLDWMVEKQGMPELDPETRGTVLDYLAEHYGQRQPEGGLSPFNQPKPLMPAQ